MSNWSKFQKNWKQGKYKKRIRLACMGVCVVCVACLGAYFMRGKQEEDSMDALRQIRQEAETAEETASPLDVSSREILNTYRDLFLQNPDLIGWLMIDGTQIDYPVMWTPEDPEYYSDKGFDKQESQNGLLFLDGASNINSYGGNLIIYGHNMKNGSMFADLLKYEKESFWQENNTIRFDTLYESRIYQIAAVAKGSDVEEFPFDFVSPDEETANLAIGRMQEMALYDTGVEMTYGDDILTLATCDYSEDDGRLVIMARRIR
ncbi:MAG: class B sortase [Clostridiales bacterium]|nr:class B sortase [Clostridiales bacterium]